MASETRLGTEGITKLRVTYVKFGPVLRTSFGTRALRLPSTCPRSVSHSLPNIFHSIGSLAVQQDEKAVDQDWVTKHLQVPPSWGCWPILNLRMLVLCRTCKLLVFHDTTSYWLCMTLSIFEIQPWPSLASFFGISDFSLPLYSPDFYCPPGFDAMAP